METKEEKKEKVLKDHKRQLTKEEAKGVRKWLSTFPLKVRKGICPFYALPPPSRCYICDSWFKGVESVLCWDASAREPTWRRRMSNTCPCQIYPLKDVIQTAQEMLKYAES